MPFKAIYTPDYSPSQGYAKLIEDDKPKESNTLSQPSQPGYPGASSELQPPPGSEPGHQTGPPDYQQPQPGCPGSIVQQPGPRQAPGWTSTRCPPGLEGLSTIDRLLVRQEVELLEAVTSFQTNNKYTIKNSLGRDVYFAVENTDCLTRNCWGSMRPFDIKIVDEFQNEVINLNRPLACTSCCCPCWLQSMEVTSSLGTVIGTVEQEWSFWKPNLLIKNTAGDVVLSIKSPFFTCFSCYEDVDFKVYSKDGENEIGKISKQWSGLARELFTDADYFGINFPMDLDVKTKAVLLGALFLIDFMFFETFPSGF